MEYLDVEDLVDCSPGGPNSVADRGLLESAAGRPQSGFGEHEMFPGLFEKAAALMHAICRNHPFVDGNKRTAWVAALTFLSLNGRLVAADEDDAVAFVLSVAAGELDVPEIARWLDDRATGTARPSGV